MKRWIQRNIWDRLPWRRNRKPKLPSVPDIKPETPPEPPREWMRYDGRTIHINPAWGFSRTYVVKHSPIAGGPRYTVDQGYHALLTHHRPALYDIPMSWPQEGVVQVVGQIPDDPVHVVWLIYPTIAPSVSMIGPDAWRAGESDYYLLARGRDG